MNCDLLSKIRCVLMVLCVSGFSCSIIKSQENTPKKPERVFAPNYRGVVYNPKWSRLPGCLYNFARRHSDDKRNIVLSGYIGLKVAYSKNFWPSIQDIVDGVEKDKDYYDIEGVEKYKDELYECLQGDLEDVDPKMVNLLDRLKNNGVKLVLASNMHQDQYEENVTHLKPELFKRFEFHHIGNQENGRKPSTRFFERFRKKVNEEFCEDNEECINNLEILHVDSKQEHIDGACNANVGIDNYHFTTLEDLEDELCKRGFLSDEECKKSSNE